MGLRRTRHVSLGSGRRRSFGLLVVCVASFSCSKQQASSRSQQHLIGGLLLSAGNGIDNVRENERDAMRHKLS